MSKSSERAVTQFVAGALTWVMSFWTAFLVMVLEGAVADNFGWPTYGYMTWYFVVALVQISGTLFFSSLIQTLTVLKGNE